MINKRQAGLALATLVLSLSAVGTALAQSYPDKPIRLVVPYPPGASTDAVGRIVGQKLSANIGQTVIVDNRAGASGNIGTEFVGRSAPDGYTFVMGTDATHASNSFLTANPTFDPIKDFTPLAIVAMNPIALVVHPSVPVNNLKELVAYSNKNDLNFAVTATGSAPHLAGVALERASGARWQYIPYKGGGDVAVQLVGNHISSTVNNPIEAESHWRAGKLRPLCVMDKQPMPYKTRLTATQSWADIPTCASAGLPVDYVMLRGIFMPPEVTPDQVAFYLDLFKRVRALPEWKEFMDKGAFNTTALTGQAFFDWLGRNEQMHRELMRDAGFLAK